MSNKNPTRRQLLKKKRKRLNRNIKKRKIIAFFTVEKEPVPLTQMPTFFQIEGSPEEKAMIKCLDKTMSLHLK